MRTTIARPALAVAAGLALAGALAGCAAETPTETPSTETDTGTTPETSTPDTGADTGSTGTYADGTYSESGQYQSPNGTETIDVTLTVAGGNVTDVQIGTNPTNPNTEFYQGEFAGGIAEQIVGKSLDSISVSKVAGSSLTSGGFMKALEAIKADASS
ncbi:uncharacterized protein with FMN-binding domain [Microbacteriaceae bacterium SG_E_30_P1]|uniref:Uncharacterized protein with FMN-binding domain n=1 Tax=Antiquaquibacter oligotrophicus TaxID=2880260 RepID=A0ABT6KKN5_9MICO|nr:hypothetical protein [Antiquaquibacter oligotrophicus]MDH6180008.1 uncharacterized protein with FMN-binding domain [Antiquaquibacter oligotrophicus]UDF14237.1 hypothetical protein LH407_05080 [Antiquaquibacter oligotrophicus]